MSKNPMRVVCSVVTNQIYASRIDVNKGIMVGNKEDVTDSAITAVGIHLQKAETDVIFELNGEKYRLTVVKEPSND